MGDFDNIGGVIGLFRLKDSSVVNVHAISNKLVLVPDPN